MNDQETSAISPVSYSTLKCERNFLGTLTRFGTAAADILFAFLIVACGSKKERPSSNFYIERVFPVEVTRVFDRRVLGFAEWLLCSSDGFHNRPSLFSSSMTLINFRLGIQPSMPPIRSISRKVREREARSPGRRGDRSPEFR
jgi:hypothetical protein